MECGGSREEQYVDGDLCLCHGQGWRHRADREAGVDPEELATRAGHVENE